MKYDSHNPLLRELLDTEELAQLRDRSLDQMLAAAGARRKRRRTIYTCLLCLPLVLGLAGNLLWMHSPHTRSLPAVSSAVPIQAVGAPGTRPATVKFITDEELFALFPRRPMALIGQPGSQWLVFLDQKP